MRDPSRIVAINVSDLHLTASAPASRGDKDWREAMARPIREIKVLQKKHGGVPVFCNGDIFDKWNAPAEVINFALAELPYMSAVPGQHDLPYHRYEDIKRSAYWTLVEAGKVKNLEPSKPWAASDDITLHGFPWGHGVVGPIKGIVPSLDIAVIHAYIWTRDHSYPGAPEGSHLKKWIPVLKGYNLACLGDNHRGFYREIPGGPNVFNCGAMLRRKSDEKDYRPMCGLVHANGKVTPHYFNTGEDVLLDKAAMVEQAISSAGGFDEFMDTLRTLGDASIDFTEAVSQAMERMKVSRELREKVMRAMG